jgi:molybdenum cofactor cytidylyltransferase
MNLKTALGLGEIPRVAFVGSGGKSTALFQLAREYASPVIITASSHLEFCQTKWGDQHFYYNEVKERFEQLRLSGITLFSGSKNSRSVRGLEPDSLQKILSYADAKQIPLLIESDGSRRHPMKAPASHEPPIPGFVDTVVVTVGISALGKPFSAAHVHRPEIYKKLSGLQEGDEISIEAVRRVLCHPAGGLKNIPATARRVVLINQADTPGLQTKARELAKSLFSVYHIVVLASLKNKEITMINYEKF